MYQKKDNNYKSYKDLESPEDQAKKAATAAPSTVVDIQSAEQKHELMRAPLCIIDFYTDWCGPCKSVAPKYIEFARRYPMCQFAKENVELGLTQIGGVPTFKIYNFGKEVYTFTGADIGTVENVLVQIIQDLQQQQAPQQQQYQPRQPHTPAPSTPGQGHWPM